jgi:hypothetical protein
VAQTTPQFKQESVTLLVVDDAAHPSHFALKEAAQIASAIPYAAIHVLYLAHKRSFHDLDEMSSSLRSEAVFHAREFGVDDRLVAVHLRAGVPTEEVADVVRDIGATVVIVDAPRRLRRRYIDALHGMIDSPVVVAVPPKVPVPRIEPPCPACVAERDRTKGQSWWCSHHAEHHLHPHHYSYRREHAFAGHDSNVIPTGTSFS